MLISKITLNNYRAFHNERGSEATKHKIEFRGKKNLLIYGENGSGKSSLYKGLKDLFYSSSDPSRVFIRNIFSQDMELEEEPFIEISITQGEDSDNFRFSSDPNLISTDKDFLRAISRTRSFITYRDLMRIHFTEAPEVNLFGFLFGSEAALLAELPNPSSSQPETRIKIAELWQLVEANPDDTNVNDFINGTNQILDDLEVSLNCLLKYFDASLSVAFGRLSREDFEVAAPGIPLIVNFFGKELDAGNEHYHHFLNEARLSALATCIFLAAHLSIPPAEYQVLFLDDIFTGLDTSNRMPLLDILSSAEIEGTNGDTFSNHQIILTTYDRHWYELAKNHLGTTDWNYQEIFIDKHSSNFDQPAMLPGEDIYERAKYYFRMKEYPACANYQRKICENLIKQFLPDHKKYDALPNGDIKPVDKLATLIDRFEAYLTEFGLSFEPFSKLRNCLRVVMNPLSHDDLESPAYRRELELVFGIIENLRKLKREVVLKSGKKVHLKKAHSETGVLREYICELKSNVVKLEYEGVTKISSIDVLPLSQQDEGTQKKAISFEGTIEQVYDKICHSLRIDQTTNLLEDFELPDGTNLNEFLNPTIS